jgi:hypothetical protein
MQNPALGWPCRAKVVCIPQKAGAGGANPAGAPINDAPDTPAHLERRHVRAGRACAIGPVPRLAGPSVLRPDNRPAAGPRCGTHNTNGSRCCCCGCPAGCGCAAPRASSWRCWSKNRRAAPASLSGCPAGLQMQNPRVRFCAVMISVRPCQKNFGAAARRTVNSRSADQRAVRRRPATPRWGTHNTNGNR